MESECLWKGQLHLSEFFIVQGVYLSRIELWRRRDRFAGLVKLGCDRESFAGYVLEVFVVWDLIPEGLGGCSILGDSDFCFGF